MKKVISIGCNKTPEAINWDDKLSLMEQNDVIHKSVGGWFEILYLNPNLPHYVIVCDEEGRCKDRACMNVIATLLYEETVVGDILIMKTIQGPEGGELVGLTDAEVQEVFDIIEAKCE